MSSPFRLEQLPGDWSPQALRLLSESGGEATVIIVTSSRLRGSNPDSHLVLARALFRRITAIGLHPNILLYESGTIAHRVEETAERFRTYGGRPIIYAAGFEPALVFIYPGENTGPNNVASPAPTAPTTSAPPPTPAPPTTPALPPTSPTPPDRQMQVHRRYQHPVFPNYHGNPLVMDNWPRDIPAEANTSLWLDGLRGDVTHRDVLASIRNAGNIKQLHINKAGDDHLGSSAAKIVFFTRQAAECVLAASLAGRFIVGGVVPRVTWNRWRTQEDPPLGRSRVLIIRGPSAIANRAFLETFWGSRMWWDVDEVIERPSCINDGRSIVRYYFGSWRCQAATAKRELEKAFGAVVVVYYGEDPCACSGRDC